MNKEDMEQLAEMVLAIKYDIIGAKYFLDEMLEKVRNNLDEVTDET